MKVPISFGSGPVDLGSHGVAINVASRQELFDAIAARWKGGKGFTLATINLDHVVKLQKLPAFARAYRAHSYVVADGNPIVWMSKLAGKPVELIPGSELLVPLAQRAAENGIPVALFGSTQSVLDKAADRLRAQIPGLEIVGCVAPPKAFDPTSEDASAQLDLLAATNARLCFLALGAPKQEQFAAQAIARMPTCGFVSIGAGIDFVSQAQIRAPKWIRAVAMEWAWRLASNPRRLAGRYFQSAAILPRLAWTIFTKKNRRIGDSSADSG